jgi:hypothetical protein
MLQKYDLPNDVIAHIFSKNGISYTMDGDEFYVFLFHRLMAQRLLTTYYNSMKPKNLLPVQFYYLLAKTGLDKVLNPLLEALEPVDRDKYAMYKAYLNGARFYEFSKATGLYNELKEKIVAINPELDFSIEQLKTLWQEAEQI